MVGFNAAIVMPANDMPADTAAGMAAPTAAACSAAPCESTLHNGGLGHREDKHRR